MTKAKTETLTKTETSIISFDTNVMSELRQALGGDPDIFSLPKMRMPSAGGKSFVLDKDTEAREISAVILAYRGQRRFHREGYDPTRSTQPDCTCFNRAPIEGPAVGHGDPGGVCAECQWNEFHSLKALGRPGEGKACSERLIMVLAVKGEAMPRIFDVPPTSLTAWKTYATRMLNQRKSLAHSITTFSIDQNGKLQLDYAGPNETQNAFITAAQQTIPSRTSTSE